MQTYLQSESEKPEDIIKNVKMEERLEWLKKVEDLGNWEVALLKELCSRIKPAFYGDRTLIVREGEPISEILFVLQGKLWAYTSSGPDHSSSQDIHLGDGDIIGAYTSSGPDHSSSQDIHLGDGDIIGKELVSWIQAQPHSSRLPISSRTVQTLKRVEAFAITAYDLKDVFINKPEPPPRKTLRSILMNIRFIRCIHSQLIRNREIL
ncbi:cyclic nucleotide-gated ion channel 1-like [Pistacia vera]|uniref:cyclic nucleotide-gated ion channel 1-like n=1 Tax=Pistacia vera TaxID=55513 RepID=UPI0012639607|nr:cyclic nucleotide-gated ion channel 1-like [Pistacia vera]